MQLKMLIQKAQKEKEAKSDANTVISSACSISGKIFGDDIVDVLGVIDGEVKSSTVNIRSSGLVKGVVFAKIVRVQGRLEGEIEAERVIMGSTSIVNGKIKYKSISIEEGAEINCEMIRIDSDNQAS